MLDGQGYDISCDLVMKVSVGGQVARADTHTDNKHQPRTNTISSIS